MKIQKRMNGDVKMSEKLISTGLFNKDNYIKTINISRGYNEQLIEFKENLFNGLYIENIGINAATILAMGDIYLKDYMLSVSLRARIAHPDVHKNIDYSPCYAELEFLNGYYLKEKFDTKGSYLLDPKDRFIGVARFELPKNIKGELILVKITIQGIYNSGAGMMPSIPRTIEKEIICK